MEKWNMSESKEITSLRSIPNQTSAGCGIINTELHLNFAFNEYYANIRDRNCVFVSWRLHLSNSVLASTILFLRLLLIETIGNFNLVKFISVCVVREEQYKLNETNDVINRRERKRESNIEVCAFCSKYFDNKIQLQAASFCNKAYTWVMRQVFTLSSKTLCRKHAIIYDWNNTHLKSKSIPSLKVANGTLEPRLSKSSCKAWIIVVLVVCLNHMHCAFYTMHMWRWKRVVIKSKL